jgi:hypothetical protein
VTILPGARTFHLDAGQAVVDAGTDARVAQAQARLVKVESQLEALRGEFRRITGALYPLAVQAHRIRVRIRKLTGAPPAEAADRKTGRLGPAGSTKGRVLAAIVTLTTEHGQPPTVRELSRAVGIAYQLAHRHVVDLEKVGSVRQKRTSDGRVIARTIVVVERQEP